MTKLRAVAGFFGKSLLMLVVAAGVYVAGGWFALGEMYRQYGGSGHPPMPSAPSGVYFKVFVVLLPILGICCGVGSLWLWKVLSTRLRG